MSTLLEVENLEKSFNGKTVVDRVSFSVERGQVMGMLGPNGAGKTTIIRMIMGVFAPDAGRITLALNGTPGGKLDKRRIGYLPEERGLYQDARVIDLLVFMAGLKGLDKATAHGKAMEWLSKWDLAGNARSKVDQLSKGMKQKLQFIGSIIHDPDFIVLDEPLSGLDPVNQDLFKEEIVRLVEQGKTILLSSHQMSLVEETCDKIFLINRGRQVVYGKLNEIKAAHGSYQVQASAPLGMERVVSLPVVEKAEQNLGRWTLVLKQGVSPGEFLEQAPGDIPYEELTVKMISLHDIFVKAVKGAEGP